MNTSRWQTRELSKSYLEGVRGAIPAAELQLDAMLKIISLWNPHCNRLMDLGCGDGILGRTIMKAFPAVHAFLVDFSDPMLEAAKKKIKPGEAIHFVEADFSSPDWKKAFAGTYGFDLVVSGFSIHHQTDARKREIYAEIFDLLNPNGIFLNLEHVASSTDAVEKIFDDYFIDHLYSFHHTANPDANREQIAAEFYKRPDKNENILAPVDMQCDWLRDIGYQDVDCFFKIFELALFGGRKIV